MKPIRLYIKNFLCHNNSFIDFTTFDSALIVGVACNSDLYSNGVGKSTIFKAIEYVLFNQSDVVLDSIVRDDTNLCQVVFDFIEGNDEFRIIRSKVRKGTSDLMLLKRSPIPNPTYHDDLHEPIIPDKNNKYWIDVSGRRAGDTEKELFKLIKINYKSFCSTVHFIQNDFSGLATATAEKRKGILKESLNLGIYSKLEKAAKEKSSALLKEIEKQKILYENIGDPALLIEDIKLRLLDLSSSINIKNDELQSINSEYETHLLIYNNLINEHLLMQKSFSSSLDKESSILKEILKLEASIEDYKSKRNKIIASVRTQLEDIKNHKNIILQLSSDFTQIESLNNLLISLKEQIAVINSEIKNNQLKLNELNIPVPDDDFCKHCRQKLTEEHKNICKLKIEEEKSDCKSKINELGLKLNLLTKEVNSNELKLKDIQSAQNKIKNHEQLIISFEKDIEQKKSICAEYLLIIDKFKDQLSSKTEELNLVKEELKKSSIEESINLKSIIDNKKIELNLLLSNKKSVNQSLLSLNNNNAVLKNDLDKKILDLNLRSELSILLAKLNEEYSIYPSVLQAFSSTGIPNLIIQNVLDDLQNEANLLLSQLKPGLQLVFLIEKTKGDGTQDDTLDIQYMIHGKTRSFNQLSGAMKLAVTFSLKLGLSFLLQKMMGTDIRFLLLDEIDQSLDKASVDSFADIIKFFQKDYNVLVITHNDRLKDKFKNIILVEQDINMISSAKVIGF